MLDEDFKIRVSEDLGELKADIRHIKNNIPVCEKAVLFEKIKTNRRLIYIVFGILTSISAFSLRSMLL